jgi:putative transposase
MEVKKYATQLLPEWTKKCPFQVKGMAIKDAVNAFYKAKGDPKFRSRHELKQSCFIPSSAIKPDAIYPKVAGRGLRYSQELPDKLQDSRLVWNAGKWFLALPQQLLRVPSGENQARVVAIDPGVRTFVTCYSTDRCGHIGEGDFSRIQRLACHLDDLLSRMSKAGRQKKRRMRMAAARMRTKIQNLVAELHHKTALFLVRNFDCILLPTFETSNMVKRAGRKIGKRSARSMLTFSHYRFKQFLKQKAFEFGKTVLDVSEAYTSKTHPETGQLRNIGSAKRIKLQSGNWANRDDVGARNILLRALVDKPELLKLSVNNA